MTRRSILDDLDLALSAGEGIHDLVRAFYDLATSADEETRDRMLESLEPRLRGHPLDRIGPLGILAGALVELGADPAKFPPAVFDRLLTELEHLRDANDDISLPQPFYMLERGAMGCLSHSAELRRTLPQKPAIVASLRRYSERYGFLGKMMSVLDDEPLVVLHPESARGFRFTMYGIGDNFQLHVLLLGALAGSMPPHIDGIAPSQEAISAASTATDTSDLLARSSWQLANWFALRPGGAIDTVDYQRSWIWNEGIPADIAAFEGTRVILIGPTTIDRSWNAQRIFPSMPARLDGPVPMDAVEARDLLSRIEAAIASR